MTDTPIPFLLSLKRESDGFANALHCAALIPGAVLAIWAGLDFFGPAGDPPDGLKTYCKFAFIVWLAFFGFCAAIDYTIFAVFRAFNEWLDAAFAAFNQAQRASENVERQSDEPVGLPPQRDTAVAYLHDFIKRTRQVTDPDSLNPSPPEAS